MKSRTAWSTKIKVFSEIIFKFFSQITFNPDLDGLYRGPFWGGGAQLKQAPSSSV